MRWIDLDHLLETTGLVDGFLVNVDGEAACRYAAKAW